MFALKSFSTIQNMKPLLRNYSRKIIDPGIQNRKQALDVSQVEEEEDFEGLESDFMDVHTSHKEYERDMQLHREKLEYHIVKRKYFKQVFPNFLTWHDKEQIKYLHSSDPEEWTVGKLAESFPALPETIKKIIRTKYTKTESKILNHDKSVQKNWELFNKGEMKHLPGDLLEHLSKFTNRSLNLSPSNLSHPKKEEINIRKKTLASNEFSEIITSYEELRQKNKKNEQNKTINIDHSITPDPDNPDSGIIGKVSDSYSVTFKQLQKEIGDKANIRKELHEDEKLILKSSDTNNSKDITTHVLKPEDVVAISRKKYQSSGGSLVKKSQRDYSHLLYPEKIVIPKDKVRKDHIYKLNDCYYDHDGRFLYRVPGME